MNPAWPTRLADPPGRPAWPTPAWPLCTARRRQRRADRDGGVVARSAPGLLFLSPLNPAWPTRLADPLAVADPRGRPPGRRRRGLCARREGDHGGRTSNGGLVARSTPGLLILSPFPPYIPPGQLLADPLAVADPPGRPEERVRTARGRTRCGLRPRPGPPRTSRRSSASPMTTGGRRCARGRPPSWIRSPDVVPPITDRNRRAVLRFQGTKSDARPPFHHLRPFARFQPARVPFRSASSLPVAPFPLGVRRASVS